MGMIATLCVLSESSPESWSSANASTARNAAPMSTSRQPLSAPRKNVAVRDFFGAGGGGGTSSGGSAGMSGVTGGVTAGDSSSDIRQLRSAVPRLRAPRQRPVLLSPHPLPSPAPARLRAPYHHVRCALPDRKSTRLNSSH